MCIDGKFCKVPRQMVAGGLCSKRRKQLDCPRLSSSMFLSNDVNINLNWFLKVLSFRMFPVHTVRQPNRNMRGQGISIPQGTRNRHFREARGSLNQRLIEDHGHARTSRRSQKQEFCNRSGNLPWYACCTENKVWQIVCFFILLIMLF